MVKFLILMMMSLNVMATENYRKPAILGEPEVIEESSGDESSEDYSEKTQLVNEIKDDQSEEEAQKIQDTQLENTEFKNIESLNFYHEIQQEMLAEERTGFKFSTNSK